MTLKFLGLSVQPYISTLYCVFVSSNAPINVKPHLSPLGQWIGEGGALAQIWSRETAPWVGLLTRAYLERFRHCA